MWRCRCKSPSRAIWRRPAIRRRSRPSIWSPACRASARDQLPGRHLRQEGHDAVHHRARTLQAQARAGAGRRGRRAGHAEAGAGRLQAPGPIWSPGRPSSQATLDQSHGRPATTRRPTCSRPQANTKIAAINYDYTHVTAPFDGIVSAHQVSVGQLVGAASPTMLATIVAARPDLCEFQRQRARRAAGARRSRAARPDAERSQELPVEVGLQTETGYPHRRQARLCRADRQPVDRHAARCAACSTTPTALAARLSSCACACRSPSRGTRCWCPTPALGSDQGGRYVLVVDEDNVVEQRKVETGPLRRRIAGDRERP